MKADFTILPLITVFLFTHVKFACAGTIAESSMKIEFLRDQDSDLELRGFRNRAVWLACLVQFPTLLQPKALSTLQFPDSFLCASQPRLRSLCRRNPQDVVSSVGGSQRRKFLSASGLSAKALRNS